jgi:uncharacterized protein
MAREAAVDLLRRGFCGHLATVGPDRYPYCVPMLYVWMDDQVFIHGTFARGHLRSNVEHDAHSCFEVDAPGEVFAYGRFQCDSSLAYQSVVLFGTIRVVHELDTRQRFCEALMAKYALATEDRPAGFFPRITQITVYAISVESITGKQTSLPEVSRRWPSADRTATPWATARAHQSSSESVK